MNTNIPLATNLMTPAWASRNLKAEDEDVINGAFSGIAIHDGEWFFTGPLGELLRDLKIPRKVDIHYDLERASCYARLAYAYPRQGKTDPSDGQNEDETWRVLYTAFTEISFALLWNERPFRIHGLPSARIALHLTTGDARAPFIFAGDIPADLCFDVPTQKFIAKRIPLGLVRQVVSELDTEEFGLPEMPMLDEPHLEEVD